MTLAHRCNTPWVDTADVELGTVPPGVYGLSQFGERVVHEMNRMGMMVDISHVDTAAMRHVLRVSRAPVIFSHSSARAVFDHPRNVPDDVLEMVRENHGIVMVNFYSCYLVPDCHSNLGTIDDVVLHIDHIRRVAGVDHVGLGADYNGVDKVPVGLEDVSKYPALFLALLETSVFDWTDEELGKLASRNLVRVMREVEAERDRSTFNGVLADQAKL